MKCLTCCRHAVDQTAMAKIFWKQNGVPVDNNLKVFIHRVRRGPRPSPNRPLARRRPLSRPGS